MGGPWGRVEGGEEEEEEGGAGGRLRRLPGVARRGGAQGRGCHGQRRMVDNNSLDDGGRRRLLRDNACDDGRWRLLGGRRGRLGCP